MSLSGSRDAGGIVRWNRLVAFLVILVLSTVLGSFAIASGLEGSPSSRSDGVAAQAAREGDPGEARDPMSRMEGAVPTRAGSVPLPDIVTTAPEEAPPPLEPSPDEAAPVPEEPPAPEAPVAPDCTVLTCVALTFDDGPSPETGRLLDILAERGVPATFFLIGGAAAAHPDLVHREVAEGHVVGDHTWSHRDLTTLPDAEIDDEIVHTRDVVAGAGGVAPTMFRPPYGAIDDRVAARIAALGFSTVLWNVDSQDWRSRDTAMVVQQVLSTVQPGSIVLMHDLYPTTIDAVPEIIDSLRAQGYTLVTVPDLRGGSLEPGTRIYSQW